MSPLPAENVAIRQLHINSAGTPHRLDLDFVGKGLRHDLECADWPQAPGESWVLIREVRANGPAHRLAETLARATTAQLQWGDASNVMRFSSLDELLAALLTDLTLARAPGRWYWRRWSHLFQLPVAQAVQRLLSEHLDLLPSVVTRLARQQVLTEVWLTLTETGASQLLQELAWRSGFEPPDAYQVEALWLASRQEEPCPKLTIDNRLRLHWSPVLRALPLTDARSRLALTLIGQQLAPLMLLQSPASLLAALINAFRTTAPSTAQSRQPAAQPDDYRESRPTAPPKMTSFSGMPKYAVDRRLDEPLQIDTDITAGRAPSHLQQRNTAAVGGRLSVDPKSGAEAVESTARRSQADHHPSPAGGSPSENPAITDDEAQSGVASKPPLHFSFPDSEFTLLSTSQGGLLYLLNFLNRTDAQNILLENWDRLPSGWGWLYRLGQTLQLDEGDPVVPFITGQLGLQQPSELELLPPLPARDELLELAHRWYGNADLWQPTLLRLEARLSSSPSHLDLYASVAAVRLPVRLAGLDINPGWLPWLGRVVTFHYD